jgi:hypothetical protein
LSGGPGTICSSRVRARTVATLATLVFFSGLVTVTLTLEKTTDSGPPSVSDRGAHPVGSGGRQGITSQTPYEAFPEIESAIDSANPRATDRALAQLGFEVEWTLIEAPGSGHRVLSPPARTIVISVLGPTGQWKGIDRTDRRLTVEIATPDVAEQLAHAPA